MMTTRCEQLQALLVAIILAVGVGLVWAAGAGILDGVVFGLFPDRPPPQQNVLELLHVLDDGAPAIATGKRDDEDNPVLRTPGGDVIKDVYALTPQFLLGPYHSTEQFRRLKWPGRLAQFHPDSGLYADLEQQHLATNWYLVHDGELHGRAYLVGYDPQTKLPIGYIGRNGFQPDKPPREAQFPLDGRLMRVRRTGGGQYRGVFLESGLSKWVRHLMCEHGLVEINFKERTAKTLYRSPDVVCFATTPKDRESLSSRPSESKKRKPEMALLLRLRDRVILMDSDGQELENYALPVELRDADLRWYRPLNGQAVVLKEDEPSNRLFWLDMAGNVLRHEDFHLRREVYKSIRRWPSKITHKAVVWFVVPSPATIAGILACNPWDYWQTDRRPQSLPYAAAVRQAFLDTWPIILANGVLSAVLAVLCYCRQRKCGLPGTWMWVLFVLLFGVPAYLGYLAHRKWPARLPCPSCSKRVPRDRPACFACGQEFPEPARTGIEIFA